MGRAVTVPWGTNAAPVQLTNSANRGGLVLARVWCEIWIECGIIFRRDISASVTTRSAGPRLTESEPLNQPQKGAKVEEAIQMRYIVCQTAHQSQVSLAKFQIRGDRCGPMPTWCASSYGPEQLTTLRMLMVEACGKWLAALARWARQNAVFDYAVVKH